MLEPGDCVADLVVEGLLGQGSYANIYQVVTSEGVLAALKVLTTTDPVAIGRLRAEGRILLDLSHPNVVGVYRVLEVDERPALLLELIEGPTLGTWLDARGRPPLEEALQLFKGIARGVQAAHARGLVHRDLNPGNVLLASQGANEVVPKVSDFGIARTLDRQEGLTGAAPLGTPAYMAPEQWQDARNADQRADVFSLGCILYELVTGERAFPGDGVDAYRRASAGEYLPARQVRPDCPEYVDELLNGMLAPDPADRQPDVPTVLELLYLDDVPSPDTTPQSAEGRHWAVSQLSTQGASLARHLAPEVDTTTTRTHPLGPPPPTSGPPGWLLPVGVGLGILAIALIAWLLL